MINHYEITVYAKNDMEIYNSRDYYGDKITKYPECKKIVDDLRKTFPSQYHTLKVYYLKCEEITDI